MTSVLIIRAEGGASPADQALAARLAAGGSVDISEQCFSRERPDDLERLLAPWKGKVTAVIGALAVPESRRLGELTEPMNALCFVGNNNPSVWENRRHVFHIGFPTPQTTAAIAAELVQNNSRRRYLLLHDTTEFQTRVAAHTEGHLRSYGMDVRSLGYRADEPIEAGEGWRPELIYVVFSSERKAFDIAQRITAQMPDVPLLFGRSLMRASFLQLLAGTPGEFWFVDTNFRRADRPTQSQREFLRAMEQNGISIPTTNHAFGWDCMKFCLAALTEAGGDPQRAISYLESGVVLEGATGSCSFSPSNHNGRHGTGPTILSRWNKGQLDGTQHVAAPATRIS